MAPPTFFLALASTHRRTPHLGDEIYMSFLLSSKERYDGIQLKTIFLALFLSCISIETIIQYISLLPT